VIAIAILLYSDYDDPRGRWPEEMYPDPLGAVSAILRAMPRLECYGNTDVGAIGPWPYTRPCC